MIIIIIMPPKIFFQLKHEIKMPFGVKTERFYVNRYLPTFTRGRFPYPPWLFSMKLQQISKHAEGYFLYCTHGRTRFFIRKVFTRKWVSKTQKPEENIKKISKARKTKMYFMVFPKLPACWKLAHTKKQFSEVNQNVAN